MDRKEFAIFTKTFNLTPCVILVEHIRERKIERKMVQVELKQYYDRTFHHYRHLFPPYPLKILQETKKNGLLQYFMPVWLFQQDLTYIMIGNLRLTFAISHLSYSSRTIPLLKKYQQPNLQFPLLNLHNNTTTPSLLSRLLNPTPHAQLLQLYLNFIQKGEEKPEGIAFQWIEENLRRAVLRKLQSEKMKIVIDKFKALSSQQIEQTEFRGVFIHRNLNLSSSAYDIKPHTNGSVTFQLKKALRSDSVQEYERIIRAYSRDRMDDIYCRGYDEYQKDFSIKRSIYKLSADISLTIDRNGSKQSIGGSPTEHLLQVESVFNRYYNMQEHFLTDVDFILGGNYFLPGNFQ